MLYRCSSGGRLAVPPSLTLRRRPRPRKPSDAGTRDGGGSVEPGIPEGVYGARRSVARTETVHRLHEKHRHRSVPHRRQDHPDSDSGRSFVLVDTTWGTPTGPGKRTISGRPTTVQRRRERRPGLQEGGRPTDNRGDDRTSSSTALVRNPCDRTQRDHPTRTVRGTDLRVYGTGHDPVTDPHDLWAVVRGKREKKSPKF